MTPRAKTSRGNPIWTETYYAARHLVYAREKIIPEEYARFNSQIIEGNGNPIVPFNVEQHIPKEHIKEWDALQEWAASKAKCAYIQRNPGVQIEAGHDDEGNMLQVKLFAIDSKQVIK